ncbi:hypothetical protein GGR58DRAFT_526969 [Xylaria digitata]|nr:hypothetical protein GGR58DRAFT_526969 [Xylaria digitata]
MISVKKEIIKFLDVQRPLRCEYDIPDADASSVEEDDRPVREEPEVFAQFEFDESMGEMIQQNLVVSLAVACVLGLFLFFTIGITFIQLFCAAFYLPVVNILTWLIQPFRGYLRVLKSTALRLISEVSGYPLVRGLMSRLDEAWNLLLAQSDRLLNCVLPGFRFVPPRHVNPTYRIVSAGFVVPPGYIAYIERIVQEEENKDKVWEEEE